MEHVFGHLDGLLPWSKEIDRASTEGVIFGAGKYCSERYLSALRKVASTLRVDAKNSCTGGGFHDDADESEEFE